MDCKFDSPAMHVGFILDGFINLVSVQTRKANIWEANNTHSGIRTRHQIGIVLLIKRFDDGPGE